VSAQTINGQMFKAVRIGAGRGADNMVIDFACSRACLLEGLLQEGIWERGYLCGGYTMCICAIGVGS